MARYLCESLAFVPAGLALRLTEEQREARQHLLATDGEGRDIPILPVQFKRGEIIELFDDVPATVAGQLTELPPAEAQGAPKTPAAQPETKPKPPRKKPHGLPGPDR